jgi:hypothetical protein
MLRLDVRRFQRSGALEWRHPFRWQWKGRDDQVDATIDCLAAADHVLLEYRARVPGGDWEPMQCRVPLDWTPCNYGGQRVWWRCPTSGCGRRVAVLFGARLFACRHCHRLAYRSQRETVADRAIRRGEHIRARLGWEPGILNPTGPKPKGMHWRTFDRLEREHYECARRAVDAMMAELEAMHRSATG